MMLHIQFDFSVAFQYVSMIQFKHYKRASWSERETVSAFSGGGTFRASAGSAGACSRDLTYTANDAASEVLTVDQQQHRR